MCRSIHEFVPQHLWNPSYATAHWALISDAGKAAWVWLSSQLANYLLNSVTVQYGTHNFMHSFDGIAAWFLVPTMFTLVKHRLLQ